MAHSTFLFVLAGLVASTVTLAGLGLLIYREMQRAVAFDRRLSVPRRRATAAGVAPNRSERSGGRYLPAFGLALVNAGSMLVPVGAAEREKLARLLRRAGFAQRDALSVFLSLKLGIALASSIGTGIWARGSEIVAQHSFLVALAVLTGFVIGGIAPEFGLRAMAVRRTRRMEAALPDALDLMVMSLESGLVFERAVTTVADELMPIEPILAEELRLMEAELRLGSDRRAVFQEFRRRTEVEGLRDLAMSLNQAERYGTPLTQSIRNIAATERTQRAARIEAQAERLPVLMTLPMLLLVVPGTLALVAGPAFLSVIAGLDAVVGGQ